MLKVFYGTHHIMFKKILFFSDVAVQFEELQGLFEVDPLLLHVFIYISPKEALPVIIKHIPIYISISWFLYLMEHSIAQVCYA